jgi:hypothetical protein
VWRHFAFSRERLTHISTTDRCAWWFRNRAHDEEGRVFVICAISLVPRNSSLGLSGTSGILAKLWLGLQIVSFVYFLFADRALTKKPNHKNVVDLLEAFNTMIETSKPTPPVDRYNLVYFIFVLLGVGFLFPWNAFISAPDYWNALYAGKNVLTYFSVIYNWPNYAVLILLLFVGSRLSPAKLIVVGFLVDAIALLYVPLIDNNLNRPEITLPLTYVAVGLTGTSGIILCEIGAI